MGAVKSHPNNAQKLTPQEAGMLDELAATRSPTWLGRFMQGFRYMTRTVSRSEFDRVCLKIVADLEGATMTPEDAQAKAVRLIKAYTQAHAGAIVPKCDYSDKAILVAWLGHPQQGFLFQRALTLKDPKGNKIAP